MRESFFQTQQRVMQRKPFRSWCRKEMSYRTERGEMTMDWQRQFRPRPVIVSLIAVIVAGIMIEVGWGLAGGLVGGVMIARDLEFQNKVTVFMQERGFDVKAHPETAKTAYEKLSPQDKKMLDNMTQDVLRRIDWFPVALSVSLIVYGMIGFLGGFFARVWLLAGAVPVMTFLTNNPVVRFEAAIRFSLPEKTVVVLLQLAVCYLLAFYGARVGMKRAEKRQKAVS